KNSLVKQYAKLFAMDGVNLRFTPDALRAVAQKAINLKTGARALRAILEQLMLEIMYDLPMRDDVGEVIIDASVVAGKRKPRLKRRSAPAKPAGPRSGGEAQDAACVRLRRSRPNVRPEPGIRAGRKCPSAGETATRRAREGGASRRPETRPGARRADGG